MKIEKKTRLLGAECSRRALKEIIEAKRLAAGQPDLEGILDQAHLDLQMAIDWIETSYRPQDLRKAKQNKGAAKGRLEKAIQSNEKRDLVRREALPGRSAQKISDKILSNHGEVIPKSTVLYYLRQISKPRN